jgi:glycosyltransferase involved in cell wall biosynthesis
MRVLFVNYNHLDANSGIYIFNLANELARLGCECSVCVPDGKHAVAALGKPLFESFDFGEARLRKQPAFDLIHAWTPREKVRSMTEELTQIYPCPYVVHLEDNEEAVLEAFLQRPVAHLLRLPSSDLDRLIPGHLSHPLRYKEFLKHSAGVSVIVERLLEFCPEHLPSEVIWAGYEAALQWNISTDAGLRTRLGLSEHDRVVVYTGNVHPANRQEVFSLYLAVGLLNRYGIRTMLVRTGQDYVPLFDETLSLLRAHCIELGRVRRQDLPSVLALADALVQPGQPDAFNSYRFPSKLPEFLASGKPVVLPAVNIGAFLKDGEECLLLQHGNALEIAQKLEYLFRNKEVRDRIGSGGRQFAEKNLQWNKIATKVQGFYERILTSGQLHPAL